MHWPELDLFRSIAATLMVINHVAVHAVGLGNLWGVPEFAFVGSFAPVFFFFLTGIGFGVQSGTRPAPPGHGYIVKVLTLFAADAMLWASPERYVGLDFFGFIGLSMLCLEWLRRAPRSGLLAGTLAALVFTARFVLGSTLKNWLASAGVSWLGAALGAQIMPGVSYPPCPWLAYPFIGYALGRLAAGWIDPVGVRRPFVLALSGAIAGLAYGATVLLVAKGFTLFRWGLMSLAYFVASVAALATGLALVLGAARFRAAQSSLRWIGLSGIRSFAVVPLHYALIPICGWLFGDVVDFGTYVRNASVVLALSFAGSMLIPRAAKAINSPLSRRFAWAVVSIGFVITYSLLVMDKLGERSGLTVRTLIQLGLCVVLGVSRRPSPANSSEIQRGRHRNDAALPSAAASSSAP